MRCGVGDYSRALAHALASLQENKVAILTSVSGIGEDSPSRHIDIFPVIERWTLREIFKIIKVIHRWSPDIVHIQYPTLGYAKGILPWFVPIVAFFMSKKVVQTWHEGYLRRHALFLLLKALVPCGLVFVRPNYKDNILHPMLRWATWRKTFEYIPNASSIPQINLTPCDKIKLKSRYINKQKRLIVFFGFMLPIKGIELIFDIANPVIDQIVIAGEMPDEGEYTTKIKSYASDERWGGKVNITGFLPSVDIAKLLAVADAVILPFRNGGGEWNTSIHSAVLNGSFVLTTSRVKNGYDENQNLYFAKVDDVQEMRLALEKYGGVRRSDGVQPNEDEWTVIAEKHKIFYNELLC